MLEAIETQLPTVIIGLELTAAALLVLGFVIATALWARDGLVQKDPAARLRYRGSLARSILIGLEVLTAATIIKTVTLTPTLDSMITLVAMVAIRTVLGWTTSLEMNGAGLGSPNQEARTVDDAEFGVRTCLWVKGQVRPAG